MGFLDEYGIKQEQIQEAGFKLPPVGRHNFVVGDAKVQNGTKNKPGEKAFIITYQLSDADGEPTGKADERRVIMQDGKVTEKASNDLGWLDRRIKDLGFPGGLSDPEFEGPDSIVGIRGTLEIVHNTQGDRKFANVQNVEVNEPGEDSDANEFAEDVPEDIAAPTKSQARRGRPKKEAAENPAAANEDLWQEE